MGMVGLGRRGASAVYYAMSPLFKVTIFSSGTYLNHLEISCNPWRSASPSWKLAALQYKVRLALKDHLIQDRPQRERTSFATHSFQMKQKIKPISEPRGKLFWPLKQGWVGFYLPWWNLMHAHLTPCPEKLLLTISTNWTFPKRQTYCSTVCWQFCWWHFCVTGFG